MRELTQILSAHRAGLTTTREVVSIIVNRIEKKAKEAFKRGCEAQRNEVVVKSPYISVKKQRYIKAKDVLTAPLAEYNEREMKTDFEVMAEMSKNNMDIKSSTNLLGVQKSSGGGIFSLGVDHKTFRDVSEPDFNDTEQTHYVVMYVVNKAQFDKLKKP